MKLAPAILERFMRDYYFDTDIDLGSSGVQSYSLSELRRLLGLGIDEMDAIVFDDSRTLGGPGLRQAIADRWAEGDARHVMATQGSSEAIFLVMTALLRPGDEVVALAPCYQQLYAFADAIGCTLKHWPLRFEDGYRADLKELERLVTPQTRLVVVNFPHNPTGVSLGPAEQRELLEVVRRVNAYLVWDGAFTDVVYDQPPLPNANLFYDRAITLNTLSKAYGLPGLRVGWCIASPDILDLCVHMRDYTTLHLSPLVELIAQRVIENTDIILRSRMAQARTNRDLTAAWVRQHGGLIEWVRPEGGVTAFPRLPRVQDVETFCRRLAVEDRVLLVPGICFNQPQHVRLGFGGPTAALEKGLAQLSDRLTAAAEQA